MRRIGSDLNCSPLPRYMTFINYRKWDLVGGRGGPAEQLVDSGTLFVHVTLRWMKVNFTMRIDRCENRFSRIEFPFFLLLLLLFYLKKSPAKLLSPPSRPGTLISYGRRGYASNYTTRIFFLPRSLSFFIFPKKKGKRKNSNDTKTKEKFLLPYRLRKNGKTNERKDGILAARSPLSLFLRAYDPIFGSALSTLICFQIIPSDSLQKFPIP